MATPYRIIIETDGHDAGAISNINSVAASLGKLPSAAQRAMSGTNSALSSIGQGLGGALTVASGVLLAQGATALASFGAQAIQAGFAFDALKQKATIAFTTMLQSGAKAKALVADITQFAAATPFQTGELIQASQALVGFGVEGDKVVETLRRLGDIAAGVGIPIGELSQIYGKARTQGRLFAEDINQLTGRGIPIIKQLAKQFGVAESEVRKLVETGQVGFGNLQQAIQDMTDEGGQFAGLTEAMSHSFDGVVSTLQDNVQQLSGILVQPLFDMATKGIEALNGVLAGPGIQAGLTAFANNFAAGLQSAISFITTTVVPAVQSLMTAFSNSPILAALGQSFRTLSGILTTEFVPAITQAATWMQTNLLPAFTEFAGWLGSTVIPGFIQLSTTLSTILLPAILGLANAIGPTLGAALTTLIGILRDQIGPALATIAGVFNTTLLPALQEFARFIGPVLSPLLLAFAELIGATLVVAVQEFARSLELMALTAQAVANAFGEALNAMIGHLTNLASAYANFLDLIGQRGGAAMARAAIGNFTKGFTDLKIAITTAQVAAVDYGKGVSKSTDAIKANTSAVLSDADALRLEQLESRRATDANADLGSSFVDAGDAALGGAGKMKQAADLMAKVADKVRGMVEAALVPTEVAARMQMSGDAWDEFRLRLEAINTGTPLDQYGPKFIEQVQKMQEATGLSLPDIAAKFKDFSLFANADWMKAAFDVGAIDLSGITASIDQQIDTIIGKAKLAAAAFQEVWANLGEQKKLDLASALGLDVTEGTEQLKSQIQGAVTSATTGIADSAVKTKVQVATEALVTADTSLQTKVQAAMSSAVAKLATVKAKVKVELVAEISGLETFKAQVETAVRGAMTALLNAFPVAVGGGQGRGELWPGLAELRNSIMVNLIGPVTEAKDMILGINTNMTGLSLAAAAVATNLAPLASAFTPFQEALVLLNKPLGIVGGLFTILRKDVEVIPGAIANIKKQLEDLSTSLKETVMPVFSEFVDGVLTAFLETVIAINEELIQMISLLKDAAKAMLEVKPSEALTSKSPSPFETTLANSNKYLDELNRTMSQFNNAGMGVGTGAPAQPTTQEITIHVDNMVVRDEEDLQRLANVLAQIIGTQTTERISLGI